MTFLGIVPTSGIANRLLSCHHKEHTTEHTGPNTFFMRYMSYMSRMTFSPNSLLEKAQVRIRITIRIRVRMTSSNSGTELGQSRICSFAKQQSICQQKTAVYMPAEDNSLCSSCYHRAVYPITRQIETKMACKRYRRIFDCERFEPHCRHRLQTLQPSGSDTPLVRIMAASGESCVSTCLCVIVESRVAPIYERFAGPRTD